MNYFIHDTNISLKWSLRGFSWFYFHIMLTRLLLQDIEVAGNSQLYFHKCLQTCEKIVPWIYSIPFVIIQLSWRLRWLVMMLWSCTCLPIARTISYWCFSASYSMSAVAVQVKSVILTSGTLKPLDSFVAELKLYVLYSMCVCLCMCVLAHVCMCLSVCVYV